MEDREEEIHKAKEELKRVDHLIYVSLKYTRTCDIFKSIIERLINSIEYMLNALLLKLEEEKKIKEIPEQPGLKCNILKQNIEDEKINEIIDSYLVLRKLNRAPFTRAREFRRHVTMTCTLEGEETEVNIDNMTEKYKQTVEYLDYVLSFLKGAQEDE